MENGIQNTEQIQSIPQQPTEVQVEQQTQEPIQVQTQQQPQEQQTQEPIQVQTQQQPIVNVNYILEAKSKFANLWSIEIEDAYKGLPVIITAYVPIQIAGTIEEVLKALNIKPTTLVNMHETRFGVALRTLEIKDDAKMYHLITKDNKTGIYSNLEMVKVRSTLDNLRKRVSYPMEIYEFGVQKWRPDFLIMETDAITVKVPTKYEYEDMSDPSWDYDYLLYPTQNMDTKIFRINDKLIEELISTSADEVLKEEIRNMKIPTNLRLFDTWTPNRYEAQRMNLREISLKTKALINIIRDKDWGHLTSSAYFSIYQNSRMARTNKAEFEEIIYKSDYSEEITFPKLFTKITGKRKEDAMDIPIETLDGILNSLDPIEDGLLIPEIEAVKFYIQALKMATPEEVLFLYEEMEESREVQRGTLFTSNFGMVGNIDFLSMYLSNIYCKGEISLFKNQYKLGIDSGNNVKLEFKKRIPKISEARGDSDFSGLNDTNVSWNCGEDSTLRTDVENEYEEYMRMVGEQERKQKQGECEKTNTPQVNQPINNIEPEETDLFKPVPVKTRSPQEILGNRVDTDGGYIPIRERKMEEVTFIEGNNKIETYFVPEIIEEEEKEEQKVKEEFKVDEISWFKPAE